MASLSVTINGRAHRINCGDGQEAHVSKLARVVDQMVQRLAATVGPVGDSTLLLMAGILLAEELNETRAELERLQQIEPAPAAAAVRTGGDATRAADLASELERLAERIDAIAEHLESA